MSNETIIISRIGAITSHLTASSSSSMASEKEAALAAVPSDSPTMLTLRYLPVYTGDHFHHRRETLRRITAALSPRFHLADLSPPPY
ncbi:hypothetical protein AKJ16_DCAP09412 [Drosera capensis]